MQFIVEDRQGVEEGIAMRVPYIAISIRDPGKHKTRIPRTTGLRGTLLLWFHDAEPTEQMMLPTGIQLMTEEDAEQISCFVQQLHEIRVIVCHCEQGMSRSPAVAQALAEASGEESCSIVRWKAPNQHVYRLLKETISRLQNILPVSERTCS